MSLLSSAGTPDRVWCQPHAYVTIIYTHRQISGSVRGAINQDILQNQKYIIQLIQQKVYYNHHRETDFIPAWIGEGNVGCFDHHFGPNIVQLLDGFQWNFYTVIYTLQHGQTIKEWIPGHRQGKGPPTASMPPDWASFWMFCVCLWSFSVFLAIH